MEEQVAVKWTTGVGLQIYGFESSTPFHAGCSYALFISLENSVDT